ncbi:MAG TPA: alanine--glyoxylate aminotransferase family protein [Chloroflexota bacterium]|nr:alanine--glyoxylate aminotransferase family protein [Chloroflexota bacterium]
MMDEEINLRVPGPTPLPPQVREALARQMMNHRGPDFAAIMHEVHASLRYFFATENPVLTFPASGTGGLEAAIVNLLSPGDEVLAVSTGVFGDRFARIAAAFGLVVHPLDYPWGRAADASGVAQALEAHPRARAVLLTQNETSTGVLNPVEAIARAARAARPDVLLLVDAISGLVAAPLLADAWDLDVVVAGSQKAWMAPPGMTMLSVGERAWEATRSARLPRLYWDFAAARKAHDQGQPPYTPAVSVYYALQVALRMMRDEGREAIWARHSALAEHTRAGVRRLGLDLFADPDHFSPSVTAVCVPDGVDASRLLRAARDTYGVVFAGGQGALSGRIIRIGHLGWVSQADIDAALDALAASLSAH